MGFFHFVSSQKLCYEPNVCICGECTGYSRLARGLREIGQKEAQAMHTATITGIFILCLNMSAAGETVGADTTGQIKDGIDELRAEHRAYFRAHRLAAEMSLFDELAVVGRTITGPSSLATSDGVTTSERESLVEAVEPAASVGNGVELFDEGFAWQIEGRIAALRDTIRRLERAVEVEKREAAR